MDNQVDEKRMVTVELLTEQNAKMIGELTKVVSKLTKTMSVEDERLKASVNALIESSKLCKQRHEHFLEALNNKKEILKEVKEELDRKADLEDVKAIKHALFKVMWGILGGVGAIVITLISVSIKHTGG